MRVSIVTHCYGTGLWFITVAVSSFINIDFDIGCYQPDMPKVHHDMSH